MILWGEAELPNQGCPGSQNKFQLLEEYVRFRAQGVIWWLMFELLLCTWERVQCTISLSILPSVCLSHFWSETSANGRKSKWKCGPLPLVCLSDPKGGSQQGTGKHWMVPSCRSSTEMSLYSGGDHKWTDMTLYQLVWTKVGPGQKEVQTNVRFPLRTLVLLYPALLNSYFCSFPLRKIISLGYLVVLFWYLLLRRSGKKVQFFQILKP